MRWALLLGLLMLVPVGGTAQRTAGDLHARVLDSSALPVPDVEVSIAGPSLLGERRTLSDAGGRFRVLGVAPGLFTLRLTRIGYRPLVLEGVRVLPGQATTLGDLRLDAQAAALPPLVVTVGAAVVDPRSTALETTLSASVFRLLPTGRDYASLLTLLPQANQSAYSDGVNVSGGTGLENAYYLDGVHVTEPYRGEGGIDLPRDFIEHLQLLSAGYEADRGRALGGVVNAVTRRGSNERHLSAFGSFTGSGLASTPERGLLDGGKGDFTRFDAGFGLGGPVRRDRLWYFLAYDAGGERQTVSLPGVGEARDRALTHHFAAKLTWRADPGTEVVLTAVGDPTKRDIVGNPFFAPLAPADSLANADPVLGVWNHGSVMLAAGAKRSIGDRVLLEASLSRTASWQENRGRTARGLSEPLVTDAVEAVWSGGYGNYLDRHSGRSAATLTGTLHFGESSIKSGLQLEDNRLDENWQWRSNAPDDAGWIARSSNALYNTFPLEARGRTHNRVLSGFLQTSVQVSPWLRLNPGVRWDGQFFSGPGGRSGSIADQLQPRLGAVAYPGHSIAEKITATFGRFYEQVPTHTVSFWWGGLVQDWFVYDHDPRLDPIGGSLLRSVYGASDHLRGQHYDEGTLGYERAAGPVTLKSRVVYRVLREILTTADSLVSGALADSTSVPLVGANPGREDALFMPRPKGSYRALELSVDDLDGSGLDYSLAYVLSRHYGNYVGLYDQDAGVGNPHGGSNFMNPSEQVNGDGLLPNDRTHAVKAFGTYRFGARVTLGAQVTMQSGTPLNYWGANPDYPGLDVVFLLPRGTAGRTPWIWDANLRVSYEVGSAAGSVPARIVVEGFHLFSPGRPVLIEQKAYLDEYLTQPNPLYGEALLRQPPMTVRVGLEIGT